jgi:hypothetical protein
VRAYQKEVAGHILRSQENEKYGRFVKAEIDRLGESNPLIRTQ